jgi:hypothetical protein
VLQGFFTSFVFCEATRDHEIRSDRRLSIERSYDCGATPKSKLPKVKMSKNIENVEFFSPLLAAATGVR